jgi:hypothetical protein
MRNETTEGTEECSGKLEHQRTNFSTYSVLSAGFAGTGEE